MLDNNEVNYLRDSLEFGDDDSVLGKGIDKAIKAGWIDKFNAEPVEKFSDSLPFHVSEKPKVDPALVKAIAEAVKEELKPWFDRLYEREQRGVLKGAREINRYLGLAVHGNNIGTLRKWFLKYGFPMVKDMMNRWYTTKGLVDKWVFENSIIMKKSIELGFLAPRNYINRLYFAPQMLTEEERDICILEINKDRAKLGMKV